MGILFRIVAGAATAISLDARQTLALLVAPLEQGPLVAPDLETEEQQQALGDPLDDVGVLPE